MTTGDITIYYYLGNTLVALKKNGTLRYVVQDHLTGTASTSDTSGNLVATIKYYPFGATRAATGTLDTDIKFTGQRLDSGIDLYYYGARYYDANIGRFISADPLVQSIWNPQSLNRYSYVTNNPLRYIDPTGLVRVAPPRPDPPVGDPFPPPPLPIIPAPAPAPVPVPTPPGSGPAPVTPSGTTPVPTPAPPATPSLPAPVPVPTPPVPVATPSPAAPTLPTAPNTAVGGGGSGWKVQPDPLSGATIVYVPESSFVAGVMSRLPTGVEGGAGAVTVNPFIIVRAEVFRPTQIPDVIAHERVHIYQQQVLGPYFLPAYGLASLVTWSYDNNIFEIMARWISGY